MITVDFELIRKIRTHISRTESQAKYLPERKKWMRLTSALDVLEDTSWAVEYYIASDFPKEIQGKYLYTYGLLQALFVQLDAIKSIHDALFDGNLTFSSEYPAAYQVREMRDDVTGHPTIRKNHQFIHLAQHSLEKNSFYYVKFDSEKQENEFDIVDVDTEKAIENVAKCTNDILQKAIEKLDDELTAYFNSHRGRKMKAIFNLLSYAAEKVFENSTMSDWGYSTTKDMVNSCEEELRKRYGAVDAVDSYKYLLDEIHELYSLIDTGLIKIPYEIRELSKKYFLQCLFSKLRELEMYCEETDQYFEDYGEDRKIIAVDDTTAINIVVSRE